MCNSKSNLTTTSHTTPPRIDKLLQKETKQTKISLHQIAEIETLQVW